MRLAFLRGKQRIDRDAPCGDHEFVIRIEDAQGRRLMTAVHQGEAAGSGLELDQLLAAKARGLIGTFLRGTGRGGLLPGEREYRWDPGSNERREVRRG